MPFKRGSWRIGNCDYGAIVSDEPAGRKLDAEDVKYYGGQLVCESVASKEVAALIVAAPDMLAELQETIDWLEERAVCLERMRPAAGGGRTLSDEIGRIRGRVALIRQLISKAKGE